MSSNYLTDGENLSTLPSILPSLSVRARLHFSLQDPCFTMFNNSSNIVIQGGTFIFFGNSDGTSLGRCSSTYISTLANLGIS